MHVQKPRGVIDIAESDSEVAMTPWTQKRFLYFCK